MELQLILDSVPATIWYKDAHNRVLKVNKAAAESVGLPAEAIEGKTCEELFPAGEAAHYYADDQEVIRSGKPKLGIVEPMRTASGETRWMRTDKIPYRDAQGNVAGVIVFALDITQQKQAEDRERLAREVLDLVNRAETFPNMIRGILRLIKQSTGIEAAGIRMRENGCDFPYYDTDGFSEDFLRAERFLCARDAAGKAICDEKGNPVLECMCGVVIRGRTVATQPFFTEGGSFWTNSTTQLLATTTAQERQTGTRNRCHDEGFESVALIPLRSGSETLGLLQLNDRRPNRFTTGMIHFFEGLGANLGLALSHKRAEMALLDSEARYHTIFQTSVDGILIADIATKAFKYVNPAACRMFGYTEKEFTRLSVADIHRKEDLPWIFEDFKAKISGDKGSSFDIPCVRKDGTLFFANLNVTTVAIEGKQYGMAFFRDITERKRAEEATQQANKDLQATLQQLQDMQKQLIQQERISALGQMAAGIAHDFNNALVPILGYSDLLLTTPGILDNREKIVEKLELVRAGAMNAAETVRRLRDFYRPPDLVEQGAVDLSGVIQDTVALTRPKWKEELQAQGNAIDIRTEITPVPPVMGNAHELSRLLTNFIFNAVDAMPKGGSITIRLHPHASGKHAVLEVRDTGVGMSEEVRRRCFDPFFTTKGGRGVGLGLSVSHGIVQRHKGSIEIQSEPGKGTKIIVQLPLEESQAVQPQAKEEPPPERLPPVPPLRVLFVDDEISARLLFGRYLETDGHTVKLAADGREGLTSFKAGRFDVVILDRAMPGMNGDELAAAIKAIAPETPVIMLTGFGDIMGDQGTHPVGVDRIMTKPLTRKTLRRALAEIMAGKQEG